MDNMVPVLVTVFTLILSGVIISAILKFSKKAHPHDKQKSRQNIIKEATRKLAQDPHNVSGLQALSDLYYRESLWDKALPIFDTMMTIAAAHPEIDQAEVALKQGVCAVKLGRTQDSFRGLLLARQLRPDNFDVNFYIGQAYVQTKEYDKAIPFLKKAIVLNHEIADTYKYLGQALYLAHRYKEALPYYKRALDVTPENRELLYQMGDALNEIGNTEKALKIFIHLRPDPDYGVQSCLAAGIIHANNNLIDKAIQDFEIGIKHTSAPLDTLTNIRYRLSQCFLKSNDISQGLYYLKEIQATIPNYKDVPQLIARFQELNQNKNLQTYLMAGNSDFVALCRKIVMTFYKRSRVKIINIAVQSEYTEVLTEINTEKWQDTVIFRFYRTTGSIGELFIRDFHAKLRDAKAGKGICFTAGIYTDEARKYIDGRPIDLIDKTMIIRILSQLDSTLALQL